MVVPRGRLLPASTDAPSDGVELLVSTRVQELVFFRTHTIIATWWVACEKCDQILLGSNVDLFFVCEKKTTKKKRDTIEKKKKKKEKERLCCSREEEETLECCTWYWYKRCRCFVVLFILHLKYIFLKLYYQILVLSLMSINTILLLLFAL